MTAININICTDRELGAQAQSVLADLGMDMSTAFSAFLTQVVDKKALPFKTMEVWKSDDFDAPMELVDSEFVEYANKVLKSIGGKVWMPYDIDETQEKSARPVRRMPKFGCMKGEIWMAEDFDAPLEEFKEYM
jgi:addiction module RelB/DinJ family antitoxin